jgi:two-component system phosphate regulon sensor histidine kinase PhoR
MINDFLELAKLEDANYKLDLIPVNLGQLIDSILVDFQPLIERNQIKLNVITLTKESIVQGDPQRLTQVVANLIGNAIKFTPPEGQITISSKIGATFTELYIEDTGPGIAADEIENLFDRFTRTENSKAFTSGTGLGLMIVKEIIEAHGGTVGVVSKLGKGSKFWVKLPHLKD